MKIKPEHYQIMLESLRKTRNNAALVDLEVNSTLSLRAIQYRWLYSTPIDGVKSSTWICDNLYPYLNDDHIDTALRRIWEETSK
jgi:hypothetical protein